MIQLVRPSEKGVDNPECVNESVSQNAGPKVATREHVSCSQDQSCNAGIDHTRCAFVIMPVPKQDRNEHNPEPLRIAFQCQLRASGGSRGTRSLRRKRQTSTRVTKQRMRS